MDIDPRFAYRAHVVDPDDDTPAEIHVETAPAAVTLDELLERVSRDQAARFGPGTLVGECLDTHNPHLPHRVLVRARGADGVPVSAWLPVVDELRLRPGSKVLLSKPDNWPEPVVIAVLRGLETPQHPDGKATVPTADEPTLRLERGQSLVITNADGQPLVQLSATPRDHASSCCRPA